nr:hypothetical protein [Clostridia bacterium]
MKELLANLKDHLTRDKLKRSLKKALQFIGNPRLLLCLAVGWLITNGWSYIMFAVGTICGIEWMVAVSGAYLAFLWLPVSPEKLVTVAIAIALLRWLFPQDEKTLAVLRGWYEKAKAAVNNRRARKAAEKTSSADES